MSQQYEAYSARSRYSLPPSPLNEDDSSSSRPRTYYSPDSIGSPTESFGSSRSRHSYTYLPYRPSYAGGAAPAASSSASPSYPPQPYSKQPAPHQRSPSSTISASSDRSVYSTNEYEPAPAPAPAPAPKFMHRAERKFTGFLGKQEEVQLSTWGKIVKGLKPKKKSSKK